MFRLAAVRIHAMDIPEARKVHTHPIPKCGGVAMAFGTLLPVFFLAKANQQISSIIIGAVIIVFFGVLDDLKNLNYRTKFSAQIFASLIVILFGDISIKSVGMLIPLDVILPDFIAVPLTLFVIVGVTNAVNLADGLDGLAGGISILSFSLIGYLAFMSENILITMISFSMVGAIFGFLRFNNYPARLFMGDAGSQLLGFLAVTLSLALTQGNTSYNSMLPLMIVGVPVLDTMSVMTRRIIEGRSPFNADRNHIHHKLLDLGFSQVEAVFAIYVIQTFLIFSGYLFRFYSEWILVLIYIIFSSGLMFIIAKAERTGWVLERQGLIAFDAIKKRLRVILKEDDTILKLCFRVLRFSVPVIFFVSCLLPSGMPVFFSIISLCIGAGLIVLFVLKSEWLERGVIRLSFYMTIPLVLYFGELNRSDFYPLFNVMYDACFLALVIPAVGVLRFTRRGHGFILTPMDYLIFLIALGIAVAPVTGGVSVHVRLLVTKMMVLFFSYEVLIGELRGKMGCLPWIESGSLLFLGVKGIFY